MKNQIKIKVLETKAENKRNNYKIVMSYKGHEFETVFHDSIYNYEHDIGLDTDDVIYSVLMDASAYAQVRDEKEFLNEFGYDEFDLYESYKRGMGFSMMYDCYAKTDVDNLKAGLKAYKGCERAYDALNRIFTSAELDELNQEFAEY